ncbi:chaperone modulator CbpM [Flavobacterium agrisoli]|uniref:Chaperone modulator CbpM n=1 Tax=Flavobacterium agrisoli TaxID=2793066 RepID=A0A934PML0_9FLAO|nr:chaperone modulator CbpM [Flavobacterium agrisoli]MBK0369163.1 chaperone modulator CbpM [Flavobacterium agrisoli]
MANSNLILIKQFCVLHDIEQNFITELNNYGLIEIVSEENEEFLLHEQLPHIEKMMRLHYDLQVNFEGIDVIANLLEKIDCLQHDLIRSHNKLRLYENENS